MGSLIRDFSYLLIREGYNYSYMESSNPLYIISDLETLEINKTENYVNYPALKHLGLHREEQEQLVD